MKIVRLGMTESSLLFLTYASKHLDLNPNIKQNISKMILQLVNWLYTTSGYYDKTVKGTKFNFDHSAVNFNFSRFIDHLRMSVAECHESQFYFHEGMIKQLFDIYKEQFISHFKIDNFVLLNDTKFSTRMPSIYNHISNKRVLVVSAFDGIIKSQYTSGNVFNLGINFPQIQSLDVVKFPYCFLNNGPHNNYFETLEYIFEQIKEKSNDFDIVLLGCGSYGHMLTHKIHTDLNKDAIYIGGCITNLFGILSTREMKYTDLKSNEFWITNIPDEYKPENYKAIEDGCYW